MFGRIKFLFIYQLLWVCFFEAARLLFLGYHFNQAKYLSFSTLLGSLLYGLRMDLSMAAYIVIPPSLVLLGSFFFPALRPIRIFQVYSCLVLIPVSLIIVADLEAFKAWGFRLDASALRFLQSPAEAAASVSHLPLLLIFLIYGLVYFTGWVLTSKSLGRFANSLEKKSHPIWGSLLLLSFTASLIIPIRGGFQLTPMNQSGVYFSTSNFGNQAAVNATWNLLYGLLDKTAKTHNPYRYLSPQKAQQIVSGLFVSKGVDTMVLTTDRPNIILVIWESFTGKAVPLVVEGKEVTPWFNRYTKKGLYFRNVFASGDRTDKGLSAILSGYPALPQTSVIRSPNKSAGLSTLSRSFLEKGYRTAFYYGGETEFANIKSYLLQGGFNRITDIHQFSKKDRGSKWGAHDGVVANRVLADLAKEESPFFTTWLTLSSHEPFEIPEDPAFKGSDDTDRFLSSLHYTDSVLGNFIRQCEQQPWWAQTLLIVVADHGHLLPDTGDRLDNFKIPMLWLGGAVKEKGVVVNKVVSQLDLAATLLSQTGQSRAGFPFSKNSFDTSIRPWAFFTFNNGFGLVQEDASVLFDNTGKYVISQKGTVSPALVEKGKALQQHTFQDFLAR